MATIAKMLERLKETKSEIFSAMKSKGIPVKDSHTFREYADLIKQIDISEDDYDENEEGDPSSSGTDPSGGGSGSGGSGAGGGSTGKKYVFTKLNITSRDQNNFIYSAGKTKPVPITSSVVSMGATKNTNTANDTLMSQAEEKKEERSKLEGYKNLCQEYLRTGKAPAGWNQAAKDYFGKDVDVSSILPADFSSALTNDISALTSSIGDIETSMRANADEDLTKYGGSEVDFTATNTIYLFDEVTCNMPDDENATFDVTFHNADGSTIYTEEDVPFGGFAVFNSSEHDLPTVKDDIEKIFAGWNPSPVNVKSSMHCYPVFTSGSTRQENEITDTWAEIMSGEKTYSVGQWKWLMLPNDVEYAVTRLTENGNDDPLTGHGPYNMSSPTNSDQDGIIGRAIRMQIVATGEQETKYTWLSMDTISGTDVPSNASSNSYTGKFGGQWSPDNEDCLTAPFTLNCAVRAGAQSKYGANHVFDITKLEDVSTVESNNELLTSYGTWAIKDWLQVLKSKLPPVLMNKIKQVDKYSSRLVNDETDEEGTPGLGWESNYSTGDSIWIPSAYELYGDSYVSNMNDTHYPVETNGITYSDVINVGECHGILRNSHLNRTFHHSGTTVTGVNYTNYVLEEQQGYPRQVAIDPNDDPVSFRIGFCTI